MSAIPACTLCGDTPAAHPAIGPNSHPFTPPLGTTLTDYAPTPGVPTVRVPCATCMARPGVGCTAPADTPAGRRGVPWLHLERVPRETYPSRYRYGKPDPGEGFGAAL